MKIKAFITLFLISFLTRSISAQGSSKGFGLWDFFSAIAEVVQNRFFVTQEEPQFNQTIINHIIEERQYPAYNWACIEKEGLFTNSDKENIFAKLLRYVRGTNKEGVSLGMQKPASVEYNNSTSITVYTVCFYIKTSHQESPPIPTDPEVKIVLRNPINIYTRRTAVRFNTADEWLAEGNKLKNQLDEEKLKVKSNIQYWNAFHPPVLEKSLRSEVWFVKA